MGMGEPSSSYSDTPRQAAYDAVIVGSGPNGLGAAITLARSGRKVLVVEQHHEPGGGCRTEESTLPGFHHDTCAAIFPMAVATTLFPGLDLERYGLEWIHPDIPLAHPLDDAPAVRMHQSIDETADQFTATDAKAYRRVFEPLLAHSDDIFKDLVAPAQIPGNFLATTQFGLRALPAALDAARLWFSDEPARALLAGNAAHSVLPLDRFLTTNAIALMLMLANHKVGWPLPKGGAASIIKALCACLEESGGEIVCGWPVRTVDELPKAKAYLFDTGPHALADLAASKLPDRFQRRLKKYRYGPGVFKIDYALSDPVPWTDGACKLAGTVHVGGGLEEITIAERETCNGRYPERPFVLSAQQSLFDHTRAPSGKQTFWAYCHVPPGSEVDMTAAIENHIERFAPGFRDTVLARHRRNCTDYQRYNPNFVGGDVIGGVTDWRQLLTRPVVSLKPHTTPAEDVFLCSSSTPPGGGVHGMCGYWAARAAMDVTA